MFCKFCEHEVDKLVDAHIIPRSFFEYTKKKSEELGWSGNLIVIANAQDQQPKRRTMVGWYDPNLVCAECEKVFGPYDTYVADLLLKNEKNQKPLIRDRQIIGWQVETFDYEMLTCFLVSLLWRAGASDQAQFKKIDLGNYLYKIKKLLLVKCSGEEDGFSFIIARFGDTAGKAYFADPHLELSGDVFGKLNVYRFYLGAGYVVYIKVDKRPFPTESLPIVATRGNPLIIMRRTDFPMSAEFKVMQKVFLDANEAQKRLASINKK